jgi:SAM-dependent methyltransferase
VGRWSWCRTLNRIAVTPPLSWVVRAPALGDRSSLSQFSDWDFRNAAAVLQWYAPHHGIGGRRILDIGCGLGGKTCYFASAGARRVVGVDIDPERIQQARNGAVRRGLGNVHFLVADGRGLPCPAATFDMVLLNDSFEHVAEPETVLAEVYRVLRDGGTAHIAFPPFRSPWGAHLFAHIRIPWAHLLFREEELVALWKSADQRGGDEPPDTASSTLDDIMPLNRMTLRRCDDIVSGSRFRVRLWRNKTPGNVGLLARIGPLREYLVTRAIVVLEK